MSAETHRSCQNERNNLKEAIKNVYETKEFCDVTFIVGQKKFNAHKLILASRCTEFSNLILDPNAVKENVIEDKCITETGFEIFLRFIYTDDLGTNDKLAIVQAFLVADHYKQKKMKEKCEELMESWSFNVDEVFELLNVSLGIVSLKEKCLNFIKRNALDVISSPNFLNLNLDAMIYILENDALKDIKLKERIVKIIEWGRHQQENPNDLTAVRDYFLSTKPPLLRMLKIEDLDLQEFGQLIASEYQKLLTPDEITNFIQYTQLKKMEVLPEWCREPKNNLG